MPAKAEAWISENEDSGVECTFTARSIMDFLTLQ
jgi:hypothetical protein